MGGMKAHCAGCPWVNRPQCPQWEGVGRWWQGGPGSEGVSPMTEGAHGVRRLLDALSAPLLF